MEPFGSDDSAQSTSLAVLSSVLYTVGSLGFLLVDLLEFFTFTEQFWLRLNVGLSALGSTAYVIGSVAFAPSLAAASPQLGSLSFLVGSALIAVSQAWKVARLRAAPRLPPPHPQEDAPLALGVEAGAGLGALCFFVGTGLLMQGWTAGGQLTAVLLVWALGSISFSLGGACLWWRHYRLGLA